jgi:hypothetical protein
VFGCMRNQVYSGTSLINIVAATACISLDGIEVDASFPGRFQDQFQGVVKHFGKTIPVSYCREVCRVAAALILVLS